MLRPRRTGAIIPNSAAQDMVTHPHVLLLCAALELAQNVSSDDENDPARPPSYAPLHDFCMMIPYAAASLAVGVAAAVMGAGIVAWATLANGAAMAALATLSLRSWKAGVLSRTYASIGFGKATMHVCSSHPVH